MNIIARLFVCGQERELLNTSMDYFRSMWYGKPSSSTHGGMITVNFQSQASDDEFLRWMIANRIDDHSTECLHELYKPKDGKITFYREHQDSGEFLPLFDYDFKDAVPVYFNEIFDNQYGMYVTMTITSAIQDYRSFSNSKNQKNKSETRLILSWQESYIELVENIPVQKTNDNYPILVDKVNKILKTKRKATKEEAKNIQNIKEEYGLKDSQNVAEIKGNIDGKSINIVSNSGKKSKPRTAETKPFKQQLLKTSATELDIQRNRLNRDVRAYDSEVKALEKVLDNTTPESTGEITITSQRDFCSSCTNAIKQFEKMRPNIKVNQVYVETYP